MHPLGRKRWAIAEGYIPTHGAESDGTLEWSETTLVVVEVTAGDARGLGYTYADGATAQVVRDKLAPIVLEADPMNIPAAWVAMTRAIRNLGRPGIAGMA